MLQLWKLNDCEYIAADSQEDAERCWKELTSEVPEDCEERELSEPFNRNEPGDTPDMTTAGQLIAEMMAEGETLPFVVGIDAHYA